MGVLDGANVLITGASQGIGAEFAKLLSRRARTIVLLAKGEEKLKKLSDELKSKNQNLEVVILPCDLSNMHELQKTIESLLSKYPIDVLINNAGLGDFAFFDKSKWQRNLQMIQVNIVALTFLTHRLVPLMVARGKGGVINVGSGTVEVLIPGAAVYNATKHYIKGFSDSLALDLAGTGVTVTQVCPGPVMTEGNKSSKLTGIVGIHPDQCAKEAVYAFDRGYQKVSPGFTFRWLLWFYSFVPDFALRTVGKMAAVGFRGQEQRALESGK